MGGLLGVYSIPFQLCGWASMVLLFLENGASKRMSYLCVLPSAYGVCLCAAYHIQVTHVGLAKALPNQEGLMIFQLSFLTGLFVLSSATLALATWSAQLPAWFFLCGNQGVVIIILMAASKCLPVQVEKAVGMMSINLALVVVFSAVLCMHVRGDGKKRVKKQR
jgi:hypothetical protein